MFNQEDIKKLIQETESLRDQYQQHLDDFTQTTPADLEGEEFIVADSNAQGNRLDLNEIYNTIKDGYKQTIESFERTIKYWNGVLSGKTDNTL